MKVFAFVLLWLPVVLLGAVPVLQETENELNSHILPLETIAFGSCLKQTRPQPIWESVLAAKPDAFVLLGDNIYGDTRDMEKMRAKWRSFDEVPGFRKLRERSRLLAVWDDHDYGENDAGADYPKKAQSQQVFLDFLSEPKDSPRRQTPGTYAAETIGPEGKRAQFILLDTRYFRSGLRRNPKRRAGQGPYAPHPLSSEATILGEAQWKWLEERLREPAELRVLASSIQVLASEHGWEAWANFPRERRRLLDLLVKTRANGVVILSGDRHAAEISKLEGVLPYPLYDITSSAMNQTRNPREEPNSLRVGKVYHRENFGILSVDWAGKAPVVTMEVRNLKGQVVEQTKMVLPASAP